MSISAGVDALRDALPENLPLSLLGIVATVLIGIVYSFITQERPLAGFPLATIDGKGPKKSWLFNGRQLVDEGLKKVCRVNVDKDGYQGGSRNKSSSRI